MAGLKSPLLCCNTLVIMKWMRWQYIIVLNLDMLSTLASAFQPTAADHKLEAITVEQK